MYTGCSNRQAPDRKTPPSASILAAFRRALGMCHTCPPCARPAARPYHPAQAHTVRSFQGRGEERSKTTTSFSHSSVAPPRKEEAGCSSHARQMHSVSCKSLSWLLQPVASHRYMHQTNEKMDIGIGHRQPALEFPLVACFRIGDYIAFYFCSAGFIEHPGTKNCAEQESPYCYAIRCRGQMRLGLSMHCT